MRLPEENNRALREERARLADQMAEMADAGLKSAEDRDKFNRLEADARRLKDRIELVERADATYRETRRSGPPPAGTLGEIGSPTEGFDREYRAAFGRYLRQGRSELTMEDRAILRLETRDMGTGGQAAFPGSSAGFFVPVGFVFEVEEAMKYYGPMLNGGPQMPRILDTDTGAPLPFPAADDTAQVGEQVDENASVTVQDVNIQQVMFGAFKYSTKVVKVSLELMQDSAFDIEDFLIAEFGRRLGRIINTKTTVGAGAVEPLGIVTAIVAGGNIVTAAGAFTNDGASAANTIGSDDLTDLEHAVDPVYRPGARYMMNDSTLKSLKKVKDKYGRPLWQESTRDGSPATINGYEYAINNALDELQGSPSSGPVTRRTVIFGDLSKHAIRRVRQLSVLRLSERFAEYGQVAFLGFGRYDSNSLDIGHRAQAILQNIY
jgi:HK97 family phage major capsid protein